MFAKSIKSFYGTTLRMTINFFVCQGNSHCCAVRLRNISALLLSLSMTCVMLMHVMPASYAMLTPENVISSYDIMRSMESQCEDADTSGLNEADIQSSSDYVKDMNANSIDWEYMQHLDLVIGAIAIETGVVKNFRFNNGYIEKITEKSHIQGFPLRRVWTKDSGRGSANVMTCLFPSASGKLNTECNLDDCFSKAFSPTGKQMARLIEIIYKIRKDKNYDARNSNEFKKLLKNWQKRKDVDGVGDETKKNQKKTLIRFINDVQIMLREQESDDINDCSNGKDLPKYTVERMILAYFIKHFNDQNDVEDFYSELAKKITVTGKSNKSKDEVLAESEKLHQVYQKFSFSSNTCYNSSDIISVGLSAFLKKRTNGKVAFSKTSSFSDCAETTIRHTINFLTYCGKDKPFLLAAEDNEENQNFLSNLEYAVNNGTEVNIKTLKERIRLFYLYQTPEKANNGSSAMRGIWNYVLSHMNEKKEETRLYKAAYSKKGNELKAGLLNALKVYWNIAFSINDGNDICNDAKNAIDDIYKNLNDDNLSEANKKIKNAFEKTFSLFNPDHKVEVEIPGKLSFVKSVQEYKTEFFGEIIVKVSDSNSELFKFKNTHLNGHAFASHLFDRRFYLTETEKDLYLDNQDTLLLYTVSNQAVSSEKIRDLNNFNAVYSKASLEKMIFPNESYKASVALKFYYLNSNNKYSLINISGTENLRYLMDNPFTFEEAKKIKVNDSNLAESIYEKISKYPEFHNFIKEYLKIKYLEGPNEGYSDPFIEEKAKDSIEGKSIVFKWIKDRKIPKEDIPYIKTFDWFRTSQNRFLMVYLIEELNDEDFETLVQNLSEQDKNNLGHELIFFESINEWLSCHNNAFEYAVRTDNISKALSILKVVDRVKCMGICKSEDDLMFFSAIGVLLKSGRIDILEKYKYKFNFDEWAYLDVCDIELSVGEFIDKMLPDPTYKTRLGIQDEQTVINFLDTII